MPAICIIETANGEQFKITYKKHSNVRHQATAYVWTVSDGWTQRETVRRNVAPTAVRAAISNVRETYPESYTPLRPSRIYAYSTLADLTPDASPESVLGALGIDVSDPDRVTIQELQGVDLASDVE